MIIAVNTSIPANSIDNGAMDFIWGCFSRIAQQNTADRFIFFSEKVLDEKQLTAANIIPVIVEPLPKNTLLLQYRLNYTLPALLRKHRVDVLVTMGYTALRTTIPQCLIINDLSFLQQPAFYKKNMAAFVAKAATVVSTSTVIKEKIIDQYAIPADKIDVAYYAVHENFKPVHWQQKDNIRQNFSGGLEYFLYAGPIYAQQNLMNLLKAFSFFKKRQKSNMQLLLVSKQASMDNELVNSLSTYKYREEVKIINNVPDEVLAKITAAAYALVYPSTAETDMSAAIKAFKSETPLLISSNKTTMEIAGEAAIYMDPANFNDMADKMMLVFKDENKRNELIIKGRQQADLYDWDKTIAAVWASVVKAVNRPII